MTRQAWAFAVAAALAMSAPALADRKPTEEERASIEEALRAEGFTTWGEIELDEDDGRLHWTVDDARASDGMLYDLELAPETFEIQTRDRED